MTGPYNYVQNIADPVQSAISGYQMGQNIRQNQLQADAMAIEIQSQRLKLQLAQQQSQQQEALQNALKTLGENPNPTFEDYNRIALMLPKEQADSLRSSWEGLNKQNQESELRFGGQVYSAIKSGNADVSINLLNQRAEAERNAGRMDKAKEYETWAKMVEQAPDSALQTMGVMLSQVPGGDKILDSSKKIADTRSAEADATKKEYEAEQTPERLQLEAQMSKAQIRNFNSQVADRVKQYNLDERRLAQEAGLKIMELQQKAGTLTAASEKVLNDSTIASQAADANATNLFSLADKYSKISGSGLFSKWGDKIAEVTGTQGEEQQIRKEYTRLRNTNVISSLPPGAASDRDISTMMAGYPEANAAPAHVAAFMRGMAKVQRYNAINEGVKAEWVAQNGSMRPAKQDMVINGVVVPAGSSMINIMRTAGEDMYNNIYKRGDDDKLAGQNMQRVGNASYMGFAGAQIVNQ